MIPFLLVLSLFTFIIVPGLVYRELVRTGAHKSIVLLVTVVMFDIGSMVDALIYILINDSVRMKLIRLLRNRFDNSMTSSSSSSGSGGGDRDVTAGVTVGVVGRMRRNTRDEESSVYGDAR